MGREDFSPRCIMSKVSFFIPPTDHSRAMAFTVLSILRASPQSFPSPNIVRRRLRSAPLTTAECFGCRVDRLFPASPLRFVPPPLLRRGLARFISPTVTNYLCQLHSAFSPTPPLRSGVGALHFTANPTPPLVFPARKGRGESLRPPFHA